MLKKKLFMFIRVYLCSFMLKKEKHEFPQISRELSKNYL